MKSAALRHRPSNRRAGWCAARGIHLPDSRERHGSARRRFGLMRSPGCGGKGVDHFPYFSVFHDSRVYFERRFIHG